MTSIGLGRADASDLHLLPFEKPGAAHPVRARPWSTTTPLTHLGGPGVRSVNFVPNVLFLSDGFTDADRGAYESLVRLVVKRLESQDRTRPFFTLLGRVNYWLASPQAGISVLNEITLNPRRPTAEDFTTFLNALRGPAHQVLGPLWTTGKDRNRVVVVCRSSHNGGDNDPLAGLGSPRRGGDAERPGPRLPPGLTAPA
ncbi:MAG: hypothetical protein ABIQ18_27635 [Umezawaea sp.]